MGFRVVAVGRGDDIAHDVKALGAHVYIDTNKQDAVEIIKGWEGRRLSCRPSLIVLPSPRLYLHSPHREN
jgi:D-arabinose 1-dehydrogenase-like Zn-dependent alcohol dehydrogenase